MIQPSSEFDWQTAVVTCHTAGCSNADAAIQVQMVNGGVVVCGVCGEVITDVAIVHDAVNDVFVAPAVE